MVESKTMREFDLKMVWREIYEEDDSAFLMS